MPRNGGFTALSNALLCLSFLPSSLLALQLNKPTRSYDGKTIYLKWTANKKDSETVYMQVICDGRVPFPPIRLPVTTSALQSSYSVLPKFSTFKSDTDCRLQAFPDQDSKSQQIAQSDIFRSLEVTPTSPMEAPTQPTSEPESQGPPDSSKLLSAKTAPTAPTIHSLSIFQPSSTPLVMNGASTRIQVPSTSPVGATGRPPFLGTSTASISDSPGVLGPTPTVSVPAEDEPGHHASHQGAIIGGVIGGLTFLALLLGFAFIYHRRRRGRLPPSAAYRTTSDNNSYGALHGTHRQIDQFQPDAKHNVDHNIVENDTVETEAEAALRRKAEIMDDLKFEAAARDGVKA